MKVAENLAQAWGIVPWLKIRIDKVPSYIGELVSPLSDDNKFVSQGVCDLAFVAPRSAAEWKQKARRLRLAVYPEGVIWVIYPKDEFREKYRFDGSLDEMIEIVRELGLQRGKTVDVNDELTSVSFML